MIGAMITVNHWPNQVLLAGANKLCFHWLLAWPGVHIPIGPMKNSQRWAKEKGTFVFHWPSEVLLAG